MGGITTAIVALPLALAFGVASGAGPAAGIYGAIFSGFFAALFGGTSKQVSGPTGPMTVVMASVFTTLQAQYPEAGLMMGFTAVILAGLMQIGLGLLKLGKYFIQVPYPVISGFMTGIGVIIIIMQMGPLLGHESVLTFAESLQDLPNWLQTASLPTLLLGTGTLAVVYLWPKAFSGWCPAPLAALILGSAGALFLTDVGAVAVVGDIPSGFPEFHWPIFTAEAAGALFYAAVLLAMIGSIDSLLTSLVADNLTKEHHNANKELIGQGLGNMAAGFFGGLPGAGATMRTVVNIRAGGQTGYSGAIHSLCLLFVMLAAGQYAAHIPLAVLAGILLKVGFDIIDWSFLRHLRRMPLLTSALMLAVLYMTVFVDLITAVLVGVFVANLITVDRLTKLQMDNVRLTQGDRILGDGKPGDDMRLEQYQGAAVLLQLQGPLSFGVGRGLRQRLRACTGHRLTIIDLTEAQLVGVSTAMILDELIAEELQQGRHLLLVGLSEKSAASLSTLGTLERVGRGKIFAELDEALDQMDSLLWDVAKLSIR